MTFKIAILFMLLVVCIMGLIAHIADSKQDDDEAEVPQDNPPYTWNDPDQ